MTASTVNGRNGCGARAGARTLNLLAAPLNSQILRALRDGPKKQVDLRHHTGHPPQTTLRAQLKRLERAGTINKRRRNSFPGVLEYELSDAGCKLLPVVAALDHWLQQAPRTSCELGSPPAKAAVKALTEGWSTTMLRALAARPLTLTELDSLINSHNYPSLERRLASMRLVDLVEAKPGDGRGRPYVITNWARHGVAPILAAVRWERSNLATEFPPVSSLDVETSMALAVALLALPGDISGSCRLAVELRTEEGRELAGVLVEVRDGHPCSCTTQLKGHPDAWVSGPLGPWLDAIAEHDPIGLELGGDTALGTALVSGLHNALFAVQIVD